MARGDDDGVALPPLSRVGPVIATPLACPIERAATPRTHSAKQREAVTQAVRRSAVLSGRAQLRNQQQRRRHDELYSLRGANCMEHRAGSAPR